MHGMAVTTMVTSVDERKGATRRATVVAIGRVFKEIPTLYTMRGTHLATRQGMRIRVAHVAELPPGKGKQIEVEGRYVTVYNREGRFVATATRPSHLHDGESIDCSQHGLMFDAYAEDSPARLHSE